MIGRPEAASFAACVGGGGIAVFPADTVYGLACDPEDAAAAARLYALKGRAPGKPAAVMFFSVPAALTALPELGPRTQGALRALLPGAVTALLPNPGRRFGPACGPDPDSLGLRVPRLSGGLVALADVGVPVLQSSANLAGGPDARRLQDVPASIRDGADLVLDGGELPGIPSTVVDLRAYEAEGSWRVLRQGAMPVEALAGAIR